MTPPALSAKSFLNVMKLPDDQRRQVLERLGAKMMDKFRTEREPVQRTALTGALSTKRA